MFSSARQFLVAVLLGVASVVVSGCGSTSPYQGMTAADLYALATRHYEGQDWQAAIRALDRLLVSFGTSDLAPRARLLLAHAHFGKGDYLTARSDYQRFLDRYPGHQEAPTAGLGVCRSLGELAPQPQRDQSYTRDALAVCRNVVIDFAGTPEAEEAARLSNDMRVRLAEKEYQSADFYFRRKLYDSAIKYYEFVVDLYPETEWAPRALLGLYQSNLAIGYDDLAEEAKEALLARYPESEAAAQIRTHGAGA